MTIPGPWGKRKQQSLPSAFSNFLCPKLKTKGQRIVHNWSEERSWPQWPWHCSTKGNDLKILWGNVDLQCGANKDGLNCPRMFYTTVIHYPRIFPNCVYLEDTQCYFCPLMHFPPQLHCDSLCAFLGANIIWDWNSPIGNAHVKHELFFDIDYLL